MTEYTAKRARTRARLLAAGRELLPSAVRRGLEHALGAGPVTQRAEVSRQSWYRYWRADDSSFLDELLHAALETTTSSMGRQLAVLAATPAAGSEAARALARAHFTLVTQRRVAIPHLVGVVLALENRVPETEQAIRPAPAQEIVRDHQARMQTALADAYGARIESWGRRPRIGSDITEIVELVGALADGYALRQIADPRGNAGHAFADATVGILEWLTEPIPGARTSSADPSAPPHTGPGTGR
jgi:hypothetical protein